MADASEQLFDAMNILIEKKLETVKFDETIQATVTDASNADAGEYMVTTGHAKFKAYSTETRYKENDAVLVTIPQGNYNNQKMIVGKQVDDMNTPMIYTSPFESIVNITNNIIPGEYMWNYYANGTEWRWGIGRKSMEIPDSNDVPDITGLYKGYNVMGIKAQFSTWLSEYDTTQGNYGLIVELTFKNEAAAAQDRNTFQTTVVFDSDEFFGDIYNFETYYTQELIFDLSEYKDYTITRVRLAPYQRNNFKTRNGETIVAPTGNDNFSTISPNIFIKDPYICFGNYIKDFNSDAAEILAINSTNTYYKEKKIAGQQRPINEKTIFQGTQEILLSNGLNASSTDQAIINYAKPLLLYKANDDDITLERSRGRYLISYNCYRRPYENKKNIALRWIHKDNATGTIATVEDKTFPTDYTVQWYRYKLGAPSPDEFAGAHWVHFYGCTDSADKDGNWVITEYDENTDSTTDNLQVLFQPNVNLQNEKIKAIILKIEQGTQGEDIKRFVASSNVLEFTNDTEVRSQPTIIDSNALSIRYDDDERGHYFLYDEAGDVGTNEDKEIRKLTAVFDETVDDVYAKAPLTIDECSSIIWTFPRETDDNGNPTPTMIVPMSSCEPDAQPLSGYQIGDEQGNDKRQSVGFAIKPHLNHVATNNTILLTIQKDGQSYQAQIQPIFGTAGTNGSDYTVILSWRDGKNALNVDQENSTLVGDIALYDQNGDVLDWPEDAEIKCEWEVAYIGPNTTRVQEKTEPGILYPVLGSNQRLENDVRYWFAPVQPNSEENIAIINSYKYYNLEAERFEPLPGTPTETYTQYQCYRPAGENENIPKLQFKVVSFKDNEPTFDDQTGNLSPISNNTAINGNQYYYSTLRRYFIKYKDQYILDPWQTYLETETYYEPQPVPATKYGTTNGYLTCTVNKQAHTVTITNKTYNNMNCFYVLKVIITHFGDYDLTTYYPIPMKSGETFSNGQQTFVVDYIEGPDRVRYGSSGETDYNKNPYKIVTRKWNNGSFETWRHGYKGDTERILPGYWKIITTPLAQNDNFYPSLRENATERVLVGENQYETKTKTVIDGKYDIPTLNPVGVYIPTAVDYAVQFVYTPQENVEQPLWTQPILVYQNKYPSRTLNKWNGKDILTDNDAGTITASGFAAGKKETDDNSFTGVIIGDWSRSVADTCITKNTGVYGFYHGAMSYAFKDDGTGFIGRDGRGRLHFDGSKAQIYSHNWKGNNPNGMLLDIDDGYIKMQSQYNNFDTHVTNAKTQFESRKTYKRTTDNTKKVYEKTGENGFDEIATGTEFKSGIYYQWDTENNKVDEENLITTDTLFTGPSVFVYGTNHTYVLWYKDIDTGELVQVQESDRYNASLQYYRKNSGEQNRYITIGSNQSVPLSIGEEPGIMSRAFRVDWNGTAHINNGEFSGTINAEVGNIGGWIIENPRIHDSSNTTILDSSNGGSITTSLGNIGGWIIESPRLHDASNTTILDSSDGGSITTSKGAIGGWTIDNRKLQSADGNTTLYANGGDQSENSDFGGNIETNSIAIVDWYNMVHGVMGYIRGWNDDGPTDAVGISTTDNRIIIHSKNSPTALRSGENVYIQSGYEAQEQEHGDGSVTASILMSAQIVLNDTGQIYLSGNSLYVDNIAAENQYGIYAKFA